MRLDTSFRSSITPTSAALATKCKSPVFTRVERTLPNITFNPYEPFVNDESAIYTDIFNFAPEKFGFKPVSPVFTGF
jgi:hypothetical protein